MHLISLFFPPTVHQRFLQWVAYRKLQLDSRWAEPHSPVLRHCVNLCYWWDDGGPAGGQISYQIRKVSLYVWIIFITSTTCVCVCQLPLPRASGSNKHKELYLFWKLSKDGFPVCTNRKGTLVKSSVLVFIGGALMAFSRRCRLPSMVILGRYITGIHSGRPGPSVSHSSSQ